MGQKSFIPIHDFQADELLVYITLIRVNHDCFINRIKGYLIPKLEQQAMEILLNNFRMSFSE